MLYLKLALLSFWFFVALVFMFTETFPLILESKIFFLNLTVED